MIMSVFFNFICFYFNSCLFTRQPALWHYRVNSFTNTILITESTINPKVIENPITSLSHYICQTESPVQFEAKTFQFQRNTLTNCVTIPKSLNISQRLKFDAFISLPPV